MTDAMLYREIAIRLNEILPRGFAAEGDAGAALTMLSAAQDVVSETTAMPWPRLPGPKLDMALPGGGVDGGVLRMWFGDDRERVLTLRAIHLSQMSSPGGG